MPHEAEDGYPHPGHAKPEFRIVGRAANPSLILPRRVSASFDAFGDYLPSPHQQFFRLIFLQRPLQGDIF